MEITKPTVEQSLLLHLILAYKRILINDRKYGPYIVRYGNYLAQLMSSNYMREEFTVLDRTLELESIDYVIFDPSITIPFIEVDQI